MSQFVVGQWVECVDDHDFRHIRNGDFYRVDAVLGNGDIRLEHVDAIYGASRFRPVEWQVGKTYRTTLEGVTATIASIERNLFIGTCSDRKEHEEWCWEADGTGRYGGSELAAADVPHLTPYLATPDEPKKERFTVEYCGGFYRVIDIATQKYCVFQLQENAIETCNALNADSDYHAEAFTWHPLPTKSEQIRDDAAKALEKVTGKVEQRDPINPPHYQQHPSGVECITITEAFNFNLGNAIKYIWRAGLKGDAVTDLEKAAWYLEREIKRANGGEA